MIVFVWCCCVCQQDPWPWHEDPSPTPTARSTTANGKKVRLTSSISSCNVIKTSRACVNTTLVCDSCNNALSIITVAYEDYYFICMNRHRFRHVYSLVAVVDPRSHWVFASLTVCGEWKGSQYWTDILIKIKGVKSQGDHCCETQHWFLKRDIWGFWHAFSG